MADSKDGGHVRNRILQNKSSRTIVTSFCCVSIIVHRRGSSLEALAVRSVLAIRAVVGAGNVTVFVGSCQCLMDRIKELEAEVERLKKTHPTKANNELKASYNSRLKLKKSFQHRRQMFTLSGLLQHAPYSSTSISVIL